MNTQQTSQDTLEEIKVKLTLAAAWASFMFFVIYLDYFHLYMPGSLATIMSGKMYIYDITQTALLAGLTVIGLPALMIFFSVVLSPRINRSVNILIAAINIPLILYNLVGEAWIHMMVGAFIQVCLLCFIICSSWKWTRIQK
jgi:hypothetical protein